MTGDGAMTREEAKYRAPLYERLIDHHLQRTASFHMPGHKSGYGMSLQAADAQAGDMLRQVMSIDYTEITGLDDLYHPEGAIADAQRLAADCFGAEETLFLVGGSTVGNLAMILTACERGDLVLVQRNVHKSVIHGLMLAGVRAVFLPPRWDAALQIAGGVDPADVREGLRRYPEVRALIISNPNYYGMGIDLQPIVELMHQHGKPVLVDEAHGAHYGFHPALPPSALSCGADVVVQSTHKMLTAMTMGAMLHVQGTRIDRTLLRQRLAMVQTSSPSYPIMATLDLCRRWLHVQGPSAFVPGLRAVEQIDAKLHELDLFGRSVAGVSLPSEGDSNAGDTQDPFKLAIYDKSGAWSGFELQQRLERHGCIVEMSDLRHALLVCSAATSERDVRMLGTALSQMREELLSSPVEPGSRAADTVTRMGAPLRQISAPIRMDLHMQGIRAGREYHKIAFVSFAEAAGRAAAEMVIPYPPGIPVLFPGERITSEMAEYLHRLHHAGARFHQTLKTPAGQVRIFVDDEACIETEN